MRAKGFLLLLGAAACLAAGAAAERPLVSRMLDARESFTPPAKAMRAEADPDAAKADWPFDVARIERMLEKRLDRAEDGSYQLKYANSEAHGSLRERADAALAYVNKVLAEWAVMELSAKFPRCDAATVRALAGYRVDMDAAFWDKFAVATEKGMSGGGSAKVSGWIAGWKVGEKLYLLLTNDLSDPSGPRDYQFVMWDGRKDWPIAGFDQLPDAARARTVLRVLESPVAANNLAAMLHAREANRAAYMPQYLESLLRRAATGGCETAFHNLGVLMEENDDREQAAAFYSRGGAKAEGK